MTLQEGQVLSFLIDAEGKTLEIHADDLHSAEEKPGDVYAARVEKVMPGLGAAFICYAPGKTGYLQLDTCSNAVMIRQSREGQIRVDDELIVQLSKLNAPPKRPIFSGRIELTGTYAVVGLPAHQACGTSDTSGSSAASAASDARSASAASAASAARSASVASAIPSLPSLLQLPPRNQLPVYPLKYPSPASLHRRCAAIGESWSGNT